MFHKMLWLLWVEEAGAVQEVFPEEMTLESDIPIGVRLSKVCRSLQSRRIRIFQPEGLVSITISPGVEYLGT